MIERPCFSSSLARAKTASAPSPVSCDIRRAIGLMTSSESYHARNLKPEALARQQKKQEGTHSLGFTQDRPRNLRRRSATRIGSGGVTTEQCSGLAFTE